jgi:hypothetical protein
VSARLLWETSAPVSPLSLTLSLFHIHTHSLSLSLADQQIFYKFGGPIGQGVSFVSITTRDRRLDKFLIKSSFFFHQKMAIENYSSDSESNPATGEVSSSGNYFPATTMPYQASFGQRSSVDPNNSYNNYYNNWGAFASQFQPSCFPYQYYYPTHHHDRTAAHGEVGHLGQYEAPSSWSQESPVGSETNEISPNIDNNNETAPNAWQASRVAQDWSGYHQTSAAAAASAYPGMANMYSMFPWMQVNRQMRSPTTPTTPSTTTLPMMSGGNYSPSSSSGKSQGHEDDEDALNNCLTSASEMNLKRPRITFSNKQIVELEKEFHFNKYVLIFFKVNLKFLERFKDQTANMFYFTICC